MAIFVDENTLVLVQGLTGGQGRFHGLRNRDYGTQVVAGVTPGKGGQDVEGIPIFDSVAEAVASTGATASFVAVPPKAAPAAILEAAAAGVGFIVCITEGIPAQDEAKVFNTLQRNFPDSRLLGPNCPGVISPGKCNIGITAGEIAQLPTADGPNVGIVSRSGTLTYQALYELKQAGIGVSTCVGVGGDPVPGTSFVDCLAEFEADPETHAVMMIGEIGGSAEEEAADFIRSSVSKPMSAYVAGVTAPAGKKMGHAGAIVSGGKGTAQGKIDALARRRRRRSGSTPQRPASSWPRSSPTSSSPVLSCRSWPDRPDLHDRTVDQSGSTTSTSPRIPSS
ncbi:MAG: succinate--CoA ligase subunit alpha [Ilumatobacteraceae bacterium]